VRESIETKRGWRGSQLNPVVAPRVRASSRGSCFAPTVDKALVALIDITDIKACVAADRCVNVFRLLPYTPWSDYATMWQTFDC